jgi:WD40 repeat protein
MIQFFQAALVTLACTILVCSKASAGANEKTIRALIAQLSDDSFEKRESAQKKLAELGEAAIRYLQEALRTSTDAEMRERASRLLMAIEQRLFSELRSTRVAGVWGTRIALTPDGKRFVTVGYDTLNVGDFENGASAMASEPGDGRLYWCVAVSSDGKRAIAGGREKIARIFDLEAGKEVQTLVGHPGEIWGAALLPDGKHAVTGGKDKSIRLWDIATGKVVRHNLVPRRHCVIQQRVNKAAIRI